ncbi:MAG: rhomboid family intramembrane serine protease, partial [Chloroflexi bacterium]|nr:rhomboid family intramembrane serine protease [Chloroflexota bacterium]
TAGSTPRVIPLNDSFVNRRTPAVTIGLIVSCAVVFVYELTLRGEQLDLFIAHWGAVPRIVLGALSGDPLVPRAALITLITSQLLHAGFLHIGGNMVFLWVFGRAVEDRLGSLPFLAFYVLAGAFAALVQCLSEGPRSTVPLIGASGAIAGVLGLYLVSYPRAWVTVLLPVLFFFWAFDLPAIVVLGFWFVAQFFQGAAAITTASHATTPAVVAVWAHVAGFVCGAVVARLLPAPSPRNRPLGPPDAPGPARLVSSMADLLALLLTARLVIVLLGLAGAASPVAGLSNMVLTATGWLVNPVHGLVPDVRLGVGMLELATLAAIPAVYLVAGLLRQMLAAGGRA